MTLRRLLLAVLVSGSSLLAGLDFAQVKQIKAATVLIEAKVGESFGSGFCISDDGYVVTNCHVVEGAPKEVRVVLRPGEPEQQIVQAEILRQDKHIDLALLRLSRAGGPLPFLGLGDAAKLFETSELTAFGYPFGTSLAVTKDAYPSVSVNTGKVTALRRLADGTLSEIQMDVLVNPGNSGGPVLDGDGKVVGVTVSGIPGAAVNFAIPVDQVRLFLAVPDLVVSAVEEIPWDQRFSPVTLQLRAQSRFPVPGQVTCRASVFVQDQERPSVIAERVAGTEWTVTAPLLEKPAPDALVNVQVETATATVITAIPNCRVMLAGDRLPEPYEWELRELKEIVPGASVKCQAGFGLGLAHMGNIGFIGLEPVEMRIADQDVTIPFGELKSLRVLDEQLMVDHVKYQVKLLLDGEEWVFFDGTIPIHPSRWKCEPLRKYPAVVVTSPQRESSSHPPPSPVWPGPTPVPASPARTPSREEPVAKVEKFPQVDLPALCAGAVWAGDGRYLLLTMPTLRNVAVLDLADRAIVGYVPMLEPGAVVAGGIDCLFVANPTNDVLERWSLDPLKRERSVPIPVEGTLRSLTLGAGCDGPLLAVSAIPDQGSKRVFIDGQSMVPMAVEVDPANSWNGQHIPTIRAAACGTVFAAWRATGYLAPEVDLYTLANGRLTTRRARIPAEYALPSPDGGLVYTGSGKVYTCDLVQAPDCPAGVRSVAPSSHPAYYLGLFLPSNASDARVSVYARGVPSPILTLPPNEVIAATGRAMAWDRAAFGKRYYLVPQLRVLAILPPTNQSVIILDVDIEQGLRALATAFLFVESTPPMAAKRGTTFRYQVVGKSSAKSLTYALDSGPDGMTMSPTGALTWEVPTTAEEVTSIIVSLAADDGQSLFHTFNLGILP